MMAAMKIGKLWLAAVLGAMPAVAVAQPSYRGNADVDVDDSYDSTAPGDPVESVDVFYDQLSPYGVWVDEPDVGRVFIPETTSFVPYTVGHWQYTSVGFVWISSEPHAWATSHYGRWAYSNNYGRWYWSPDTQWGPAWVEWRETGNHFGWAPLAPDVVIRAGWSPPVESWHYINHEHILDANVTRYYEPRTRVVEIHREARPIQHYATVSNVRVVVGPPAATLREHHLVARPVRVEARTVGRWAPAEARAQVVRAQEHRVSFETQNQRRIEVDPRIHAAHSKVVEAHPTIKAQVNERIQVGRPTAPTRVEPTRVEPTRVEPARPAEPGRPRGPIEPTHGVPGHEHGSPVIPPRPSEPAHAEPQHPAPRPPAEHAPPQRVEPQHPVEHAPPQRPEPQHPVEHAPPQRVQPSHPAPTPQHVEPPRPAPPQPRPASPPHVEPAHPAPSTPPAPAHPAAPAPKEHDHH